MLSSFLTPFFGCVLECQFVTLVLDGLLHAFMENAFVVLVEVLLQALLGFGVLNKLLGDPGIDHLDTWTLLGDVGRLVPGILKSINPEVAPYVESSRFDEFLFEHCFDLLTESRSYGLHVDGEDVFHYRSLSTLWDDLT